jgi:hypothetical protein
MVRAYEALMNRVISQGTGTFSQSHREPPESSSNGKIPGYENMGFLERRAAQDALKNRR